MTLVWLDISGVSAAVVDAELIDDGRFAVHQSVQGLRPYFVSGWVATHVGTGKALMVSRSSSREETIDRTEMFLEWCEDAGVYDAFDEYHLTDARMFRRLISASMKRGDWPL